MAELDLREICTFVIDVAREAGGIIRSAKPTTSNTLSKKNSEFDRA